MLRFIKTQEKVCFEDKVKLTQELPLTGTMAINQGEEKVASSGLSKLLKAAR